MDENEQIVANAQNLTAEVYSATSDADQRCLFCGQAPCKCDEVRPHDGAGR